MSDYEKTNTFADAFADLNAYRATLPRTSPTAPKSDDDGTDESPGWLESTVHP